MSEITQEFRSEFSEKHEMSMEFVDWFFDRKYKGCGNVWFIMCAAMWEGWQASRTAIEISPVEEYSDSPLDIIYEQPDNLSRDEVTQFGYMRGYNDCINELSTSHGIRIKGKTE